MRGIQDVLKASLEQLKRWVEFDVEEVKEMTVGASETEWVKVVKGE